MGFFSAMDINFIYSRFLQCGTFSTDSRSIKPGCLFFALKGESFNGNNFAADALKKGAALAIVDEAEACLDNRYILVNDVLETLQQLARHHREQFHFPVLGITGSNGKTTTKELISAVLAKKYKLVYSQGNLNNHIGVPLTLLNITTDTEFAVVEMGANNPGEIRMLCEIARPTTGLITSIGRAHLGGFGSMEVIIHTKKALYDVVQDQGGRVFVNADNPLLLSLSENYSRILYGSSTGVKCRCQLQDNHPYLHLSFFYDGKSYPLKSKLIGSYNFDNLQAAVAVGLEYNVAPEAIVDALESYVPQNNRSQVIQTGRNLLILDAYNANPSSMKAALESFLLLESEPKAVILGDMLELGDYEEDEHLNIFSWLEIHPEIRVFLTGPVFSRLNRNNNFTVFSNVTSLKDYLFQYPLNSYTILIKGSRGIQLEKVTEAL